MERTRSENVSRPSYRHPKKLHRSQQHAAALVASGFAPQHQRAENFSTHAQLVTQVFKSAASALQQRLHARHGGAAGRRARPVMQGNRAVACASWEQAALAQVSMLQCM